MERKQIRLKNYDYSSNGYYFITICTANKEKTLGEIETGNLLNAPKPQLSLLGKIVKNQLDVMSDFYHEIKIEKYVIMPNHIHLIVNIVQDNGMPETFHNGNNILSRFIGTLKRYTNKAGNKNLWQRSFYDHVIRDEKDYLRIA